MGKGLKVTIFPNRKEPVLSRLYRADSSIDRPFGGLERRAAPLLFCLKLISGKYSNFSCFESLKS